MKNLFTGAFAIAAIAAPLHAQAENKIYGQVNVSAAHADASSTGNCAGSTASGDFTQLCAQDGQSGDNNASRLGFQGEKGQFFYAVELGLGADDGSGLGHTRHAFVGFNSSIGTFTFGRTNTGYKLAGQRIDPFYDTSAAGYAGGFSPEGTSYGQSNLINGWTNNSIGWLSPEVAGLTLNAGVHLQEFNNEDHDFNIGVGYNMDWLNVGVQYIAVGSDAVGSPEAIAGSGAVDTAIQATASVEMGALVVGASFEMVELRGSSEERAYAKLAGSYDLSENLTVAASVGQVDQGTGEGLGFTVGGFVKLIDEFQMYGLFSSVDFDNNDKNDTFSVGVKYSFED